MRRLIVLVLGIGSLLAANGTRSELSAQEELNAQLPGRRYALLVGVNEYREGQGLNRLAFAENDIEVLADRLEAAGYHVTTLTHAAGRDRVTRIPTARNIRDAIERVLGNPQLQPQDTVLVALAGHGVTVRIQEGESSSVDEKFFFCPTDADLEPLLERASEDDFPSRTDAQERHSLVSIDELYESLASFDRVTGKGCRAGLRLVLVDACRTDPSRFSETRSSRDTSLPPLPPPPGGLVTFFSCSEHEVAYENSELEHGVFFHFVIEGLKGKADLDRDGEVAVPELNQYVSRSVYDFVAAEYDGRQNPELEGRLRGPASLLDVTEEIIEGQKGELHEVEGLSSLRMVWIPPGKLTTGGSVNESGRDSGVNSLDVELARGFWLGETEVTQAQWEEVMGTTPWQGRSNVRSGGDYPATNVSWNDAMNFGQRLTERERAAGRLSTSQVYGLPTEAQWQYACRAETQTAYYWGSSYREIDRYAWFRGNTFNVGQSYPHQVGQKQANAWGLYDMSGNVCEWCADSYGSGRLHLGGSGASDASRCRSDSRRGDAPGHRDTFLGFRIALVFAETNE